MWFFVVGDLWIFTGYFACYAYDRGQSAELFLGGQQSLQQGFGVFNTVLLLTSSYLVALCVQSVRNNALAIARRQLLAGSGLGIVFLVVKATEWYAKVQAGLNPEFTAFYLYYFMLTGLHVLHVCFGLLLLRLVYGELTKRSQPQMAFVEAAAIYWHFVDLLWIILFALLYMMR